MFHSVITVCKFFISSPVLICSNDISRTIPLGSGGVSIIYDETTATDNSGIVNVVGCSHNSGYLFTPGTTVVNYVVSDPSDNTAECSWLVTVIEGMNIIFIKMSPGRKNLVCAFGT